jgi:hypothetical protein
LKNAFERWNTVSKEIKAEEEIKRKVEEDKKKRLEEGKAIGNCLANKKLELVRQKINIICKYEYYTYYGRKSDTIIH